jgi:predicted nucleic acid-binding protein
VKYSIDTSAILDGWIRDYPPKVFPSIWANIETLVESSDLRASEEVLHELEKKDDEVFKWAKKQSGLFLPVDRSVQVAVTNILSKHERLVDTRKNRSAADPFMIALAQVNNAIVVTGETRTNSAERPHIPDVCAVLNIPCLNLLGLFQTEGWKV